MGFACCVIPWKSPDIEMGTWFSYLHCDAQTSWHPMGLQHRNYTDEGKWRQVTQHQSWEPLSWWCLMSTGKAVFKPCQQRLSLHCCHYSGHSFILQVRWSCLPPRTPQSAEILHFSSFVITQVAICSQISRAEPTQGSSQPSGHEIQSLLACLSSS